MSTVHERIKTVMLIVLLCGAVFMAYSTWFYDSPMSERALGGLISGESAMGGDLFASMETAQEMLPIRICIKNSAGRVGAEHSADAVSTLYDGTRALVAEALSVQSGGWYRTEESVWENALSGAGVMYDYQGMVRADTLTDWLWGGAGEAGAIKGRYLMLAVNPEAEGGALILMKNPENHTVYAARTQLKNDTVTTVLDGISGDSVYLAAEKREKDHEKLVPETFLRDDAPKPLIISGYNAVSYLTEEQEAAFLKCFGFTPYAVSEYTDPDGTRVYIGDTAATVSIEKTGFVTYSDTDADPDRINGIFVQSARDVPEGAEIFETARALVSRLAMIVGGEGRLYPMDFTYYSEYNSWVADFGWCVNGVPVDRRETGYAARVVIRDRRVVEASLYMRGYRSTDRTAAIISRRLATAAVAEGEEPCELEMRYTDAGGTEIEPGWYVKNN